MLSSGRGFLRASPQRKKAMALRGKTRKSPRREIIDELLEGVSIASSQYGTYKTVDMDMYLCRYAVNTDFKDKLVEDACFSYELKAVTEIPRAHFMDKKLQDELKAALYP